MWYSPLSREVLLEGGWGLVRDMYLGHLGHALKRLWYGTMIYLFFLLLTHDVSDLIHHVLPAPTI